MKILIFALLLLFSSYSFSQYGSIQGKIINSSNSPVLYANVLLKNTSDSTLIKGEITDEDGKFSFEYIKYGSYLVSIRSIEFTDTTFYLNLVKETLDLGNVKLESELQSLNEVSVVAMKPMITMHADKMVVHVEGNPISQGNTAWELLSKLPGVTVMDGSIILRGKSGVNVFVNDKPIMLSGSDFENYLKSIHASQVKDIELITNPSAKYDAQGNSGIINIVLAKPSGAGLHGSVATGYGRGKGTNKAYLNLNLSHSGKKGDLIFSLSDNYYEAFNNLDVRKNFYLNDSLIGIVRNDNGMDLDNNSLTSRLGYDWYATPKTLVSFLVNGSFSSGSWDNRSHSLLSDGNDQLNNEILFSSQSKDAWLNYSGNTRIKHTIDTLGQSITADFDFAQFKTNSSNDFESIILNNAGIIIDTVIENGNQVGPLSIFSGKIDYSKPFKNGLSFESGLKSSYVKSDRDVSFYYDGDLNQLDSTKSNHFIYIENINAGYVNLSKSFKKLQTQIGLRLEHTLAKGNQVTYDVQFRREYIKLFPTLFLNYQFNEKHSLGLNAGRRINRPQYQQLNPFIRPIDATAWASGNPDLGPEFTYNVELTYSFKNRLFIQGAYKYTTDGIFTVLALDPVTQITLQKDDNVDVYSEYALVVLYNAPIKKWWHVNFNFTGYNSQFDGTLLGYYFKRSLPTFYSSLQNTFLLKGGFKIEQSYTYMHRHLYGTTLIKPMHSLSFGVKKDILKKKGSIALNIADVFWTNYPKGEVDFNGVEEFWSSQRDTRTIYIHFSYNFGKGKNVQIRRETGADDEKKRAN